jgi:hypothetical protein
MFHTDLELANETFWLSVSLLNRYLEESNSQDSNSALAACIFISSKFEELDPPSICTFVDFFGIDDEMCIIREELKILDILGWNLCIPTPYTFLKRYFTIINASSIVRTLALFYSESIVYQSVPLAPKASIIAATALFAALTTDSLEVSIGDTDSSCDSSIANSDTFRFRHHDIPVWPATLIQETGLDTDDMLPFAWSLMNSVQSILDQEDGCQLYLKYSDEVMHCVVEMKHASFDRMI